MFSFFKNLFKKNEETVEPIMDNELSISIPSEVEIETIEINQEGGEIKYYDNIFSRNISKL
jgi:hypothetical protein